MAGDSEANAARYGPLDEDVDAKYAAFEAQQIADGKVCGSCKFFDHEDMFGAGWCQVDEGGRDSGETCRHWSKRT